MMKKYTLNVSGTHCNSCKVLIEDVLGDVSGLKNVEVDVATKKINVESEIENQNEIVDKINEKLKEFNYTVSV